MKRALEKLGWKKLKTSKIYTYMNQRKGYFEIFQDNKNGLEIGIYEDGGLVICSNKWTNIEPQAVHALIEDIKAISNLQGVDEELLNKVTRPDNTKNINAMKPVFTKQDNSINVPDGWEMTKEEFSVEGFGIIHIRSKIAQVLIYVDDTNPVKDYKADVLITTEHGNEHMTFSSNVERTVLVNLSAQKGEPYKVAKDLLEQCIKKVRNV